MTDFLYSFNSVVIVVILFLLFLTANEGGYRLGRHASRPHEGRRTQTNSIQAAMLGLLALLLGFTFTMALQRYDSRSEAV